MTQWCLWGQMYPLITSEWTCLNILFCIQRQITDIAICHRIVLEMCCRRPGKECNGDYFSECSPLLTDAAEYNPGRPRIHIRLRKTDTHSDTCSSYIRPNGTKHPTSYTCMYVNGIYIAPTSDKVLRGAKAVGGKVRFQFPFKCRRTGRWQFDVRRE